MIKFPLPRDARARYVGPSNHLLCHTGLVRECDWSPNWVEVQFDNHCTGMGYGWYRFPSGSFELLPDSFEASPPLTEGKVRKGGQNTYPSQVKERPAAPKNLAGKDL